MILLYSLFDIKITIAIIQLFIVCYKEELKRTNTGQLVFMFTIFIILYMQIKQFGRNLEIWKASITQKRLYYLLKFQGKQFRILV